MRRRFTSDQQLAHYRAYFLDALQEDGIVCLECGTVRQALGTHVRRNGLTLEEYRAKWGYNRATGLVARALQARQRAQAIRQGLAALAPPDALEKTLAARRRATPSRRLEARVRDRAAARARFGSGAQPANRKMSAETLRALVAAGLTQREIGEQVGLDRSQVARRIRALGLVGPAITPFQLKATDVELLAPREQGFWPVEIARRG